MGAATEQKKNNQKNEQKAASTSDKKNESTALQIDNPADQYSEDIKTCIQKKIRKYRKKIDKIENTAKEDPERLTPEQKEMLQSRSLVTEVFAEMQSLEAELIKVQVPSLVVPVIKPKIVEKEVIKEVTVIQPPPDLPDNDLLMRFNYLQANGILLDNEFKDWLQAVLSAEDLSVLREWCFSLVVSADSRSSRMNFFATEMKKLGQKSEDKPDKCSVSYKTIARWIDEIAKEVDSRERERAVKDTSKRYLEEMQIKEKAPAPAQKKEKAAEPAPKKEEKPARQSSKPTSTPVPPQQQAEKVAEKPSAPAPVKAAPVVEAPATAAPTTAPAKVQEAAKTPPEQPQEKPTTFWGTPAVQGSNRKPAPKKAAAPAEKPADKDSAPEAPAPTKGDKGKGDSKGEKGDNYKGKGKGYKGDRDGKGKGKGKNKGKGYKGGKHNDWKDSH